MTKRKRIYRAHPCAKFGDEEAAWIGQQLEEGGEEITPKHLVDAARSAKSPGHKLFEWDDSVAGEAYRLQQATGHLRMVQIEIVNHGNKQPIRACFPVYQSDGADGAKRSHVSYDRIKDTPDLARQVIERGANELRQWQKRYSLYTNVFETVFQAIEEVEKDLWPSKQSTASAKTGRSTGTTKKQSQSRKK